MTTLFIHYRLSGLPMTRELFFIWRKSPQTVHRSMSDSEHLGCWFISQQLHCRAFGIKFLKRMATSLQLYPLKTQHACSITSINAYLGSANVLLSSSNNYRFLCRVWQVNFTRLFLVRKRQFRKLFKAPLISPFYISMGIFHFQALHYNGRNTSLGQIYQKPILYVVAWFSHYEKLGRSKDFVQ